MAGRKVKLIPGKTIRPDKGAMFRRGKPSVEQAYRIALAAVDEEVEDFDFSEWQQLNCVAPPPRPGMVQCFIRVQLGGETDWKNEIAYNQAKWSPRIDEVTNNRPLQIGDMVLMERPISVHNRVVKHLAITNANLIQSIVDNDFTERLSGRGGFGPLTVELSEVSEEIIPMVDEDE